MSAVFKTQMSSQTNEQDSFWHAVLSKDIRQDGRFVFAVKTTKIYCRPSCGARRARRENVTFFRLPEAAEQAGYRACLRCHPNRAKSADPQIEMVKKACRLIETSEDEKLSLEALSKQLGLSSFHLQRTFKSIMGISPRQYGAACRTNRFRAHVRSGESVTAAMYDAGYGSSSRLYERANAELGMTPATYSRRGHQTAISYAISTTPLGQLLIAATDKGVCAVKLADTNDELERELRSEYAAAEISNDNEMLRNATEQIVEHLKAKQPRIELPLDLRATAFQRQVWEALQAIPFGETRSYREVAKEIGRPSAVRAVARACATNPVALVIPCHRVIREDKSLGGYRWGLERKKKLLAAEKENGFPKES